jgi:alpha-tubulin suppressor-like RCC1 family protein
VDSQAHHKRLFNALSKDVEVYTWGSGQEGALGHGSFEDLAVPRAVARLKAGVVREIVCGAGHSLILTEDYRVYAWGFNKVGQLGQGDFVDRAVPCEVSLPNDVCHIRSGAGHCFALTKEGRVYSWGFGEYYQTGHNSQENLSSPTLLRSLRSISDVACGITHTLLLTVGGQVLSVGYNSQGQCGVRRICQFCMHPERVDLEHTVKKIAAGGAHSLFLTASAAVYACGLNSNGQCSGSSSVVLTPQPVKVSPASFMTETDGPLGGIAAIAAGEETSAALTHSGGLLVWGWNGCGQLGQGHFSNLTSPALVSLDEPVVSVSCGVCQIAFVTASGKLFKTGWEGERGTFLKSPRAALVSRVFDNDYTVKLVCCGRTHIVATAVNSPEPNKPVQEPLPTEDTSEIEADKPTFSSKSVWRNRLCADKEPDKLLPILAIQSCKSLGVLPKNRQEGEDVRKTLHETPVSRGSKSRSQRNRRQLDQYAELSVKGLTGEATKATTSAQPVIARNEAQFSDTFDELRGLKSKSIPPSEPRTKKKNLDTQQLHERLLQKFDRVLDRRPPSGKANDFEILKARIAIVDNRIQSKQRDILANSRRKEATGSPTKRTGGGFSRV